METESIKAAAKRVCRRSKAMPWILEFTNEDLGSLSPGELLDWKLELFALAKYGLVEEDFLLQLPSNKNFTFKRFNLEALSYLPSLQADLKAALRNIVDGKPSELPLRNIVVRMTVTGERIILQAQSDQPWDAFRFVTIQLLGRYGANVRRCKEYKMGKCHNFFSAK